MGRGQKQPKQTLVFCFLGVTIGWTALLTPVLPHSNPWLAHLDWWTRFWMYFDAFGAPGPYGFLNGGGLVPDWLGMFPVGLEPILLKMISNLLLYGKDQSLPIFFFIHGIMILYIWIGGWWLRLSSARTTFGITFVGLVFISTFPTLLIALLAIPFTFWLQKDTNGKFWGLLVLHVCLFAAPLSSIIDSIVVLVYLYRSFDLRRVVATVVFIGLSTLPIVKLAQTPSHANVSSQNSRKSFIDYCRQKIRMPLPSQSMVKIPIGRFRLEEIGPEFALLSYFFDQDWGDSFDHAQAPKVRLSGIGFSHQLQPFWIENDRSPYSYRLSYAHLGKLEIWVPSKEIEGVRLSSLELVK